MVGFLTLSAHQGSDATIVTGPRRIALTKGPTLERNAPNSEVSTAEAGIEQNTIHAQLERIVAHPLFKNSKRYPTMLRYVVQRAIEGQTDHLKERTLGVAVFGRDPDYDTNLDPVVRVTAGEIRKRIAQYYHEPGHEAEIRIDFPSGSYLPEFHPPEVAAAAVPIAVPPAAVRKKVSPVITASLACAAILAAVLVFKSGVPVAPIDRFWAPLLQSAEPVLVYVGASYPEAPLEAAVTMTDLHKAERVGFADAEALANLTAYLATKKKAYRLRLQEDGQLNELKEGPAVLIGAFSNSFTLRLTDPTRFSFVRLVDSHQVGIRDRQDPQNVAWFRSPDVHYTDVKEDYALVSRVWDSTTGRVAVTVAGLSKYGTAAAGEFLSTPSYIEQITQNAPKDWDRKNIELVIATSVVGRTSGPPRILAAHFW
jgi:hypothetical protein